MIPAVFAIIDKSQNGFPMQIKNVLCDPEMLWDYFHDNNNRLCNAMRGILGVEPNAPCFIGVYVEYLIEPSTGRVCRDDSGESKDEFLQNVYDRHRALMNDGGVAILVAGN